MINFLKEEEFMAKMAILEDLFLDWLSCYTQLKKKNLSPNHKIELELLGDWLIKQIKANQK